MRKELFNWAIICMVAFVSIGLASCSNDDDSNDDNETIDANAIFGTWQLVLEEGYDDEDDEYYSTDRSTKDRRRYYHIDKDGTCVEYFIRFGEGVNARWSITNMSNYALDAENKRIRFDSSEWNELITLTSSTMKIKEIWDKSWEITTYTKVDDSVLDDIK